MGVEEEEISVIETQITEERVVAETLIVEMTVETLIVEMAHR